jgi:phosphatidylglycerophosphatase A
MTISIVMAILTLAASVVCVAFAPAAIAAVGQNDPREVVADEVAGQAVTFIAVLFITLKTASTGSIWAITAAGFVLFRIFDITKPWPIRKLEKLPSGWGILVDDILAGVYAGICFWIFCRYLNPWS